MQFSMDEGVFGLLSTAQEAKASPEYTFYIKGDLCQMSSQGSFLKKYGFSVSQSNVYPVIKEEDVPKALRLIYESRVEGWWHYKEKYTELGICTPEEFDEALKIQCDRS